MARKPVSASMRWAVFARDNFTCRYCGVQAGQDGVVLHADHLISVVDGGDNSLGNLITACQRCNGGKGAKSLTNMVPTTAEMSQRSLERSQSLIDQANAAEEAIRANKALRQQAVNIKCDAYGVNSIIMVQSEQATMVNLMREFGADQLLEWYHLAAGRGIYDNKAIKYVCGIARNKRAEAADA